MENADNVVNIYDVDDNEKVVAPEPKKTTTKSSFTKTTVNGRTITLTGRNVVINDGELWVDGVKVEDDTDDDRKVVYRDVIVEGNCDSVQTDSGNVSVRVDSGSINTLSGDVTVHGDVDGNVKTMSGDVECGSVSGSVGTMSGDVSHR